MQALCLSCQLGYPETSEYESEEFIIRVYCYHHNCEVDTRVKCPYYLNEEDE